MNKHIGIKKSDNNIISLNNNDIELNYDNLEYYMKQEFENELGKDVYSKISKILSKYNSNIYSFEYDKLEKNIREELSIYDKETIDNAIIKIPDIYCILIKEKVV